MGHPCATSLPLYFSTSYLLVSLAPGRCLSLRDWGIRRFGASVPAEASVVAAAGRAASVPAEALTDAEDGFCVRGASVPAEASTAAADGRFGRAASVPAEALADAEAGFAVRGASVPAEAAKLAPDCAKALLASRENTRLSVTFDIVVPFYHEGDDDFIVLF